MIDFDKWNREFGGEDALKALAESNKSDFQEVPDGLYICKLEKLELAESKKGKPMIKGMFRIARGNCKNQCLFVNQVITPGFPMHKGLDFLRNLNVFDESEIDFDGNFSDFNDLLLDIAENAEGLKFGVRKTKDGEYSRIEVFDSFEG